MHCFNDIGPYRWPTTNPSAAVSMLAAKHEEVDEAFSMEFMQDVQNADLAERGLSFRSANAISQTERTVMTATLAAPARRVRNTPQDAGLRSRALAALQAAVALAVDSASDDTLEAIVSARNDPAQALAVAPRDLAPAPPERLVAERAAKARTVHFRAELTAKARGMLARADVADLLGVGSAAVDKQRQRRQILGVPYGADIRFPAAQFKDGRAVPGLKPILAAFDDMNPWGQLQLLVAPIEGFSVEPASILDLLARDLDEDTRDQLAGLVRGWAA